MPRRPRALALAAMLLLATLLSAVLVALSAQPAQAHTPVVQPSCSGLAVSATSYGDVANHVTVVIDGETVVDERFGRAFQRTIGWSQSADHTWSVSIDQGDGDRYDLERSGTQPACQPTTETAVAAEPTMQDLCGPAYALTVPADGTGYRFDGDESGVVDGAGDVVVTATLLPGFVWQGGGTEPRSWTFPVTDEPCTTGAIPAPTFAEVCGPDGEAPYALPTGVEHVRYVVTDPGTYVGGERVVVVVAELDAGYAAPEGAVTSWTHTFHEQPCDTPVAGVASAEVVVTGATCTAPGTATTGGIERASWTVVDVPAGGGRATFVAVAEEGSAFAAGLSGVSQDLATRTFVVDVPAAGGELCSIAPPPVQPPTAETPPTATQAGPPTLPRTGFDVASILALGALLAAAGSALVVRRVRAAG
ncbi:MULTISPECIES: LPXTG cell wall anchor domain-containing protein [unclassified Agrococcus]|uniref:LPXTG cell wall anchor domain-containing protein n=1 Tax=unclassified Agrococcus TaxID=2615065 RepID=UPI00360B219A